MLSWGFVQENKQKVENAQYQANLYFFLNKMNQIVCSFHKLNKHEIFCIH